MATSTEPDASTRFWRLVAMVLLTLAVCGFGFATLCGGVFTVMGLGAGMGEYGTAFLVISLPSLLIGGWLCYLCARQLRKIWRQLDPPEQG
jgi:hypothetical protein